MVAAMAWLAIAIPLALLTGAFIRRGMGGDGE